MDASMAATPAVASAAAQTPATAAALGPSSVLRGLLTHAVLGLCISALTVAAYDKLIRQPSTPRLAVVDVAKLYAEAERLATQRTLESGARTSGAESAGTSAEFAGAARAAADFGPALEQLLRSVSAECRCTIVAMAAVYGSDATVPDFTADIAQRMRSGMGYGMHSSAQSGIHSGTPGQATPGDAPAARTEQ